MSRGTMCQLDSKVDFLRRLADTVERALGTSTTVLLTQGEALEIIANLREWANQLDWPAAPKL